MENDKILIGCPDCGARGMGKPSMTQAPVKCPKCGNMVVFKAVESQGMDKQYLQSEPSHTVNDKESTSEGMPSGFGISSFNFGILSFLIAWVPFLGLLGIPLSVIGLVMGIVGIILSLTLKKTTIGFSIAGTSISAVALILAIYSTTKATSSITNMFSNLSDTSQNISTRSEESILNTESDIKEEVNWQSALNDIIHQNIKIRVISCEIDKIPLKDMFGDQAVSQKRLLGIGISLTNLSETNKMTYQTWAGGDLSFMTDYATLADNFENVYKRIDFGYSNEVLGSTKTGSIYPGESLIDFLVFEKPIGKVENLKLELPASNFGGAGTIYIEIPRRLIRNLN